MDAYYPVAIVTLVTGLMIFGMAITVARTHGATGLLAPIMTGHPQLERVIRGHMNTIEWVPIFLPSMWLFAIYWDVTWAAIIGVVWIVGRIAYFVGYLVEPNRRYPGFFIQAVATFTLLLGALGRITFLWIA